MSLRTRGAPLVLAIALAACSDTPTAPLAGAPRGTINVVAMRGDRLATIEAEGRFPALYVQDVDGKDRVRVSFTNVQDRIAGNWPAELLPVTDQTILALGPAKWSPDGQQLAIVVTVAFDQSQVVVLNADGHHMRTASPNGQIILGDIDWSPDSRRIAYAMSTQPRAQGVDLFVTDLTMDVVHRITHDERFGVYDEYRFDTAGQGLWYTQFEGWTEDGRNRVSRVYHASLNGEVEGMPEKLVGNPQGLARDGSWGIVLRHLRDNDVAMELVRSPLGKGDEQVLGVGDLWYAELLERDDEAVVVGTMRDAGAFGFHRLGLAVPGDHRGMLDVGKTAISMAFVRALR